MACGLIRAITIISWIALYDEIAKGPRAAGPQHFSLTTRDGSLTGPFNAFLLAPELGRPLQALGAAVRYATALTDREREIAILIVAARWKSAFEQYAHERVDRAAGLSVQEIDSLKGNGTANLSGRELAVAELTRLLLDGELSNAEWTRWAEPVGNAMVFELSTLVGYYGMLALQLRVFRVNAPPQY